MNKEKKIGVSKIVIQIGDKEATLTVEQARELKEALNTLLGEKVVEKIVEHDHWYPYQPYVYPRYWTVTCGNDEVAKTGVSWQLTSTGGNTTYGTQTYGDTTTR